MNTIEMARDAGFGGTASEFQIKAIERFIDIIRADEREACAKVCETQAGHGPAYENWWEFAAAIRARSNK